MNRTLLLLFSILMFVSCDRGSLNQNTPANKFNEYGPAEYLWERWTYPNTYFDQAKFDKVMQDVRLRNYASRSASANWRAEGPYNLGGRINCIAINPYDETELFIGTSSGGIFRTYDEGLNWEAVGADFINMSIGSIAYDPTDPNVLYAGTGDPNISSTPKTGFGLYKSVDGGDSWFFLGPEEVGIISKILVHPTQPDILYIASMGVPYYQDNNRGLYKSTDGGQSWEQILFLSPQAGITTLVFHPDFPDTLYAGGWDRIRNNQQSIVSGSAGRVYRSFDGGENWIELSNGLPGGNLTRAAVDIALSNPAVLYVSFLNPDDFEFEGIYRTSDYGDSWQEVNSSSLYGSQGGFGWYFGLTRVTPTDENQVTVGGVMLHTSNNAGNSWFQSTPDWWLYEVHADMHDLAFTPSGKLWLATDGGLYLGDEDFTNWEYRSYLPISQFYRITVNPHQPGIYAGGMQDNGTSAGSYQNVNNWPRLFGGDGFQCLYDFNDAEVFYVSTQNGGKYVDTFFGFEDFTSGIGSERRAWDVPWIMSAHSSQLMYTGTTKIYKASNGPDSFWQSISPELTGPPDYYPANRHAVTAIAESPINPQILYAGTSDGRVWATQNGGSNWTNITAGLPDRYVTDIVASDVMEGRVFVTHSGYKDGDNSPHLHASDDFGANWYSLAGDMPEIGVNHIEVYRSEGDSIIFLGTDAGVYYSTNSGQNWLMAGDNMPNILVFDLAIDYFENRLVAGTFARSIQSLSLDSLFSFTVSLAEAREAEEVLKVYPNPATDRIQFRWPAGMLGDLRVHVLDFRGKMVLEAYYPSAQPELTLALDRLEPGTYIIRVMGNDFNQQTKFIKTQ